MADMTDPVLPTGDPSAGGLGSGSLRAADEETLESGSGGIDDLNVVKASDPRLGLTNRGQKPAEDWAADTGQRGFRIAASRSKTPPMTPAPWLLTSPEARKRAGKTVRR